VVSQCGLVVPADDMSALAAAVVRLADDRAARLALGRQARTYAEQHFEIDLVLARLFGSEPGPMADAAPGSAVLPASP
jgi:glycosyltransferase involved in cell wall biosynthesis